MRNRWIAGVLSFLSPGAGQLYAYRPLRALGAFAASLLALVVLAQGTIAIPVQPWNVILGVGGGFAILFGIVADAARVAADRPKLTPRPWYDRWYVYLMLILGLGYGVREPIRSFLQKSVAEPFRIPSGSMEPTLLIGDFLYVRRGENALRPPQLGEVIVFRSVEEPELEVVSRVVGLSADTVAMRAGRFLRNGDLIAEGYLRPGRAPRDEGVAFRAKMREWQRAAYVGPAREAYQPTLHDWGPLVVPAGMVFTLGDNRDNSYDGRFWGFLPLSNITGRPSTIYYSYDVSSTAPLRYLSTIRWNRIGGRVE